MTGFKNDIHRILLFVKYNRGHLPSWRIRMNPDKQSIRTILTLLVFISVLGYVFSYFNYFETPSSDYIGNFIPQVADYMNGHFPGDQFKILPLYPAILAVLTPLNQIRADDPVYLTAIVLNFILFIPYLVIVYRIFRMYLDEWTGLASLMYLSVNIYTVYTAVNAELEMLLSLLCVSGIYLSMKGSRFSYAAAFLAGITKYDAIFMIPAVMFGDFIKRKRRILSILLGSAAASGILVWLVISAMKSTNTNVYVSEIAHRGPNIYRFPIDCLLIVSGFIQWMGLEGYYASTRIVAIPRYFIAALFLIFSSVCTIWGCILFIKKHRRTGEPILIFFAGFLTIHMIYQNTKDRYVLPILWVLVLFLFIGLSDGLYPFLKELIFRIPPLFRRVIISISLTAAGILFIWSSSMLVSDSSYNALIYSAVMSALSAAALFMFFSSRNRILLVFLILLSSGSINLQVHYGVHAMDHHSLSRVEFKQAALWYRENYQPGDKMFIAEVSLPMYYSKLPRASYVDPGEITSIDLIDLIEESRVRKITYIFVDDFYIRRLKVGDRNAIDRKAALFKEVRDNGTKSGHFELINHYTIKGNKHSYLFRFNP